MEVAAAGVQRPQVLGRQGGGVRQHSRGGQEDLTAPRHPGSTQEAPSNNTTPRVSESTERQKLNAALTESSVVGFPFVT